jgi:hypothetical protein
MQLRKVFEIIQILRTSFGNGKRVSGQRDELLQEVFEVGMKRSLLHRPGSD